MVFDRVEILNAIAQDGRIVVSEIWSRNMRRIAKPI
jgi:hypothetical protein